VAIPPLYYIFPPSDSQINMHFFASHWTVHQLTTTIDAPLRAFMPIPAWWKYNCWNTQCLLEAQEQYKILKFINPIISAGLLALACFILRKYKKGLLLFAANVVLSFIISATAFALVTARYAGFLYIGFITAWWLCCYETPRIRLNSPIATVLLIVQLAAGIFFVLKDIRLPFSNLYQINELVREVPAGERLVTDYWTMNAFVAYTGKPAYCVDLQKETNFISWGPDVAVLQNMPNRYSAGIRTLLQREGLKRLYMITMGKPQLLFGADPQLPSLFRVQLVDKREGAIEKGSNLYLYRVSSIDNK
jgi:hypothetical protein